MGKTLAKNIKGMSLRIKICIVFMLLVGGFIYQGVIKPLIGDTATNTYYFTTDTGSVNLGADGNTNTTATLGSRISMRLGTPYTTSRSVTASSVTTEQIMIKSYGPLVTGTAGTKMTLSAPAVTIGVRDRNGTTNNINWKAYIYDYDPAVASNITNATLSSKPALWTSNAVEAHPSVQTPLELTFTNPVPKDVSAGHRLVVVITCQMASPASLARLYWGNSTNYSFFTVSEAPYVANSVTVNNLADYYGGALTTVTQGDSNIPMLQFDLYTNAAGSVTWTDGKLDKIGTNTSLWIDDIDEPGDVSFSIFKDADNDGVFETTDTLIGGPYNFKTATQAYTLPIAQTITSTPQRYFIVYNIRKNSTYNTTVGARIANNTYFTVTNAAGGIQNVTSTSSSTPNIQYGGVAVTRSYAADWDNGTSLSGISETGATQPSPNATDSACITRNTTGGSFPLVGLLNYPAHSCASVAGQGYSTTTAQPDFTRLYFGGTGYPSIMKTIKGGSFVYRVYTPGGGGTVTLQLFYVTSTGVRVNAPIASTYTTTNSVSQTITTSLAGQDFSNVPAGARLGLQIGVTANMRIGLGSSVGAQVTVQETAAENENVDVGNGTTIAKADVHASDIDKVIDGFSLSASKPKTVNSITIQGSALFNSTNVTQVRIYEDLGTTIGALDAGDTLIGSTNTISGTSATISGLNLAVTTKVRKYIVVVNIGAAPNTNVTLTALVSNLTVATIGKMGENSDSASGTLTILPTTTLTNGAAEPANLIIPSGAPATRIDAFALKTNGGINDTISNVTVTLSSSPALALGKISSYVGRVDITNSSGTSLGHLTAPTQNDNWQISTVGLAATTTNTDYFVTVTPKGNQNITYTVKALVTAVSHSRLTNNMLLSDTTSATITMDQQPPTEPAGPALTAVTGAYNDTDLAQVNLSWGASTDASGSAVSYILVRGLANAPAPQKCTVDGVKVFSVSSGTNNASNTYINKGLNEGVSYGYRLCTIDSVGNISTGTTSSATASIKNRCSEVPELTISPMDSFIKAGNSINMSVAVTNKDTGVCGATTFTLSIVGPGTDVADSNFNTSSFLDNNFTLATNNDAKYTQLTITAKPGAAEKALKTFHVKVTKSTGLVSTTCPEAIYVVVNKFGTLTHSSLQLGTKYGSWGIDYNCSTCHAPDSTNIKQVKNTIATPTGNRQVTFSITSTNRSANVTGVFGNDNRSGAASSNVCEVCHHNARFHQYSTGKVAWKDHNNNSDCTRCHSHSVGFKASSAFANCDDCHGNPPTTYAELVVPPTNVLPVYGSNAGSHAKHNARLLACTTCHSNANHSASAVPDKKLNMGFSIKAANFTGFVGNITSGKLRTAYPSSTYSYKGANGTIIEQAPGAIMNCNVYCHGWNGDGGYNTEPAWTGVNQVGCGSCHAASNDAPPTSGSHHKHTSNEPGFGNGIKCSKCHGFRNYSTSSAHINGNVEWDLSTFTETVGTYRSAQKGSTGKKAPTAPGSYGSCTNLYCHSNVVSSVNNNGTGAPNVFNTPAWGSVTTCNSCHIAQPNTTGGHPQHAGSGVTGFDCRICHGSGGDANPLNHGNEKIDFLFSGLAENTHYSYSSSKVPGSGTYGTCYNSNCHGDRRPKTGPTALAWGGTTAKPLCDKCHSSSATAGGFYGTTGPNGSKLNTDLYVGAHFNHITTLTIGGTARNKYSTKIDCSACHYKPTGPYSPGHMDTPLPAEVNFGSLAASGLQGTFTSAAHLPTYNFGTKTCNSLWCHGGGMDSNEGTGPYGSVGPTLDGGALGSPAPAVWNAPFLTGVATNDCVKCHAYPPAAPKSGYTHWDDNKLPSGGPYIANQCILCHKHVNAAGDGFKNPALHVNGVVDSCNTCHGRPPIDEKSMTLPAIGALTPGFIGAHQAHSLNPSIKNDCAVCHYNYSQEMPSYQMEMGFNAYGGKVVSGTFYGYSTLSDKADNYTTKIVYKSTNTGTTVRRTKNIAILNTCANLYCHGGGTATLAALGGGTNIKPNWEGGSSQATCGTCHGVTGETYKTRGSHGVHTGKGYGMLGLGCSNCHGIKENNYHVDGKVEWEFYSTAKRLNLLVSNPNYTPAAGNGTAGPSGFTNNLAPSASYGTCQVYCHSNGRGVFASPLPVWGGPALNCGSCHINQTSTFDGSHQKHSASSANGGYGIDCLICHSGSGFASPRHINGTIDVVFDTGVVGPSPIWNSVNKTCFNILCHISTVSSGPTWGNAATGNYDTGTYKPTCIGCHSGNVGGRAAVIPQFAGASHHIQGVALSGSYCYPCHMEANTDGTVNLTYHDRSANKTVDLVLWGAGSRGTAFTRYTANGNATRKRTEYVKLNNVCTSCHNATNAGTKPFSTAGDNRTPKDYAWDGGDIKTKFTDAGTTLWGKFSGNNTNNKSTATKAYSAHGNATVNERGWDTTNGTDVIAYTVPATKNVVCFDCHNSHGTNGTGIMSSYSSTTGRNSGAILKSTVASTGGYAASYTPSGGGSAATKDLYNPGAGICFDCHGNQTSDTNYPWGYNDTYGIPAGKSIYGYWDSIKFGGSGFPAATRFPYKAGSGDVKNTHAGGHFGASSTLSNPPDALHQIKGLCTPCHDPHGISSNTAKIKDKQYAVPLLKGSWVTSPYKEDAAPASMTVPRGGTNHDSRYPARGIGSTPRYNIDQTTFQTATNGRPEAGSIWGALTYNPRTGVMAQYSTARTAGLCMGCHSKANLVNATAASATTWKSKERIHQTVTNWAATTGTGSNLSNKMHSFTCSKCHTPHNYRLPRLLVTNCLDAKHRGSAVGYTGGNPANPTNTGKSSSGAGAGRFPSGGGGSTGRGSAINPGPWFFGVTNGSSNTVPTLAANLNCHQTGTAGGTTYGGYTTMKWNKKSQW